MLCSAFNYLTNCTINYYNHKIFLKQGEHFYTISGRKRNKRVRSKNRRHYRKKVYGSKLLKACSHKQKRFLIQNIFPACGKENFMRPLLEQTMEVQTRNLRLQSNNACQNKFRRNTIKHQVTGPTY